MEDIFEQFVDSDALDLIISSTPLPLHHYVFTVISLDELPLPTSTIEVIDGQLQFKDLALPFTSPFKELTNLDPEQDTIKQLAKIDGIIESLKTQHQQNIQTYISYFNPVRELPVIDDIEQIRKFANASSLSSAFAPNSKSCEQIDILPKFSKESQATLQSALACQMAGLSKPAQRLFSEFFEYQLLDMNAGFNRFLDSISNEIGRIKTSSQAGKSGRNKRYEKSDKVKAFAIKLYCEGNFKNPHQASHLIAAEVISYGKSIGYPFTSEYQPQKPSKDG